MFVRAKQLSLVIAVLMGSQFPASWIDSAAAEDSPAEQESEAAEFPRLEAYRERYRGAAERLRDATPQLRERRRERMHERLSEARSELRRRMLRREHRIMHFLSEDERKAIRLERRDFRQRHRLDLRGDFGHGQRERRSLGEFEFSSRERYLLRARFHQLRDEERKELREKIRNMRELPAAERELLRERLREMKSLSEDEVLALHEKAERWDAMSDAKREALRVQMRRLRALPTDERLELLERVLDEKSDGSGETEPAE